MFQKPNLKDLNHAYSLIKEILPPTPLVKNFWLSQKYNANIYLKLENLQPVGSFKLRGGLNKLAYLTSNSLEESSLSGVVAASAGNHAQGVAFAARHYSIPATIVMPENSPLTKVEKTKALGAEVVLKGLQISDSLEYAKELEQKNKLTFVHPYFDREVIAGQASLIFELNNQLDNIDLIATTIGGGGLISGLVLGAKALGLKTKFLGSQSRVSSNFIRSLSMGKIEEKFSTDSTFADGINVKKVEPALFDILKNKIDFMYSLDDFYISESLVDLMEKASIVTEGAASLNLSALDSLYKENPSAVEGKNIVLVICGGNIDTNLIGRIIDQGLMRSNRKLKLEVMLKDKPGELMKMMMDLDSQGVNILEVHHRRSDPNLALDQSYVEMLIETKGHQHAENVIRTLEKKFKLISSSL